MNPAALNGLDLLATAVVVVDDNQAVLYMNPAAVIPVIPSMRSKSLPTAVSV